uniref:Putative cop9 signalosome complex subunit 7 n=1 Tax=Nyssomyia neivai TaxID=330878 RepID=A0A1L8DW43_9DIPT
MSHSFEENSPTVTTHNALEHFVALAKMAKGAACLHLIEQLLEAPGVYVFGELLQIPNIMELEGSPNVKYYNALNLFAYGTYKQYLEKKDQILELNPTMKKKLQHLTIVTLAIQNKCIPYATLLIELDISNVRDLEDLIIEAIYADIIHGKLDQKNSQLEVDYAIGRDIRPGDINQIVDTLQEWCDSCAAVLNCIETQIHRANAEKARTISHKDKIEQEIVNLKKAIKSQAIDCDEAMPMEMREQSNQESRKKSTKSKAGKSGGKLWFKMTN